MNRCDQLVRDIKRLGDYESFYACEQEKCFKFFENEAKLNAHNEQLHG